MSWAVYSYFLEDRRIFARVAGLALALILTGPPAVEAQDRPFQFALMGDTGYTIEDIEGFKRLLAAVNAADLSFVVHVGDFENDGRAYTRNPSVGPMPCTDESFQAVYDSFQSVRHPFILTPGDNDWTDCHGVEARKFDPLERLAKLRNMFFPDGRSLGQRTMPVISQATDPEFGKFRENLRWSMGGVTFVTLHIVGSNDNFRSHPGNGCRASRTKGREYCLVAQCVQRGQNQQHSRARATHASQSKLRKLLANRSEKYLPAHDSGHTRPRKG